MGRITHLAVLLFLIIMPVAAMATASTTQPQSPTPRSKAINFGAMYGFQWGYYLVSQEKTIRDHGSLRNWYTNPFSPRFDRDGFEYNIFKHTISGNYYYLYYRSRGYQLKEAFFWTFMSSLAFEFTIETATEKPSYQDIYQTPVFGTVMGIGMDKLSHYFHGWDNWYGHALGYLFNPLTLIPDFTGEGRLTPIVDNNHYGVSIAYRF